VNFLKLGPVFSFIVSASLLLPAIAIAGSEGTRVQNASGDATEVEELRRLELRGARTNVEGWTLDEAKAFFAPQWVSVGPDGKIAGADSVFASFVDGRSRPWASRFDLVELDIRVYGVVAVVIGLAEAEGIGAPAGTKPTRFRYLNVWRKVNGRWLYSEQQFTRF
jgi:ketosteroid isomerase-like protein